MVTSDCEYNWDGYSLLDTIVCSDCFDLMAGLPPQSVDAIITDMPYGATACTWDSRVDLPTWWTAVKRILKPRGVMVTTGSQPFTSLLVCSNLDWFRYEWVWDKRIITGWLDAKRKPLKRHENILVFSENGAFYDPQMHSRLRARTVKRAGGTSIYGKNERDNLSIYNIDTKRYPTSILDDFGNQPVLNIHPTQKPVALYEYLIRTYTQPGDIVLDPFCGSGTTAVAVFRTGRHYICGDSSQEYVDIARQRLQTIDPYQPTPLPDGSVQLSLFADAPT